MLLWGPAQKTNLNPKKDPPYIIKGVRWWPSFCRLQFKGCNGAFILYIYIYVYEKDMNSHELFPATASDKSTPPLTALDSNVACASRPEPSGGCELSGGVSL